MILGILFVLNMLSANYALLFIPYLEQAIGRNCRYLMVVIIGAFFSRVKKGSNLKLPPKKILVAAVITTGVLSFTILVLYLLFRAKISIKKEIMTPINNGKVT